MNKAPDTPQIHAYYRFKGDDYYCLSQYLLYTGAAAAIYPGMVNKQPLPPLSVRGIRRREKKATTDRPHLRDDEHKQIIPALSANSRNKGMNYYSVSLSPFLHGGAAAIDPN